MLPLYADTIVDARQRGLRPDGVVFISIGKIGVRAAHPNNFCVIVTPWVPISRLDFSWCIALVIEIAAERVKGNSRCIALCEAVITMSARNVVVWDVSSGERWWLMDELGPWPKPFRLSEPDRSLVPKEGVNAACA